MTMDRDHLRALARVAHLPLGDAEAESLAAEFAVILRRLEPLRRVDVAAAPPLVSPDGAGPREDGGAPDVLVRGPAAFAPGFRDPWFVVPRLASHADASPDLPSDVSSDETAGDTSAEETEGGR